MLCLRVPAGASCLDTIWYGVNVDHVKEYLLDTVRKIDTVVDSIRLPETDEDIRTNAFSRRVVPAALLPEWSVLVSSDVNRFLVLT